MNESHRGHRPRLLLCALALGLFTIAGSPRQASSSEPGEVRVLCYNIHHGRGNDDKVDLERIATVIRNCQPDLVALQEVDNRTMRTGKVDQTAELARLTGLQGKFIKQIDFEGGEYGQALLSTAAISNVEIVWLPGEPPRERRIVGMGQVELNGQKIRFCSTHLHHQNAEFRLRQVQEINRSLAQGSELLTIIAGDFNAEPGTSPLVELERSWSLARAAQPLLTFPSAQPIKQIDYIATRPRDALKLVSIEVIQETIASDHRPLFAVYRR